MPFQDLVIRRRVSEDGIPAVRPDGYPDVAVDINTSKQFVRDYWLTSLPPSAVLAAFGAAGDSARFDYPIDSQGHFDWTYLMGQFTTGLAGQVLLDIVDQGSLRALSNKPVFATTIVGSGQRPFMLPKPYFFDVGDSERALLIKCKNFAAQQNTVQIVPFGRRLYSKEMPVGMMEEIRKHLLGDLKCYSYFLVPTDYDPDGVPTLVAGLGPGRFTFEMDDSADMELTKLMLSASAAFTFTLFERDTQRTLSTGIVHSANGWGNAEFPLYLQDSYLLQRKRQLILEVRNLSAQANRIFATIGGKRYQIR